jgi:hypothetical protein
VGFFVGTQLSGIFVNTYGTDGTLSPENWQLFWGIFAVATLVFAIVFFALFKDDTEKESVVV